MSSHRSGFLRPVNPWAKRQKNWDSSIKMIFLLLKRWLRGAYAADVTFLSLPSFPREVWRPSSSLTSRALFSLSIVIVRKPSQILPHLLSEGESYLVPTNSTFPSLSLSLSVYLSPFSGHDDRTLGFLSPLSHHRFFPLLYIKFWKGPLAEMNTQKSSVSLSLTCTMKILTTESQSRKQKRIEEEETESRTGRSVVCSWERTDCSAKFNVMGPS